VPDGTLIATVPPMLFATQTASRRLSGEGGVVVPLAHGPLAGLVSLTVVTLSVVLAAAGVGAATPSSTSPATGTTLISDANLVATVSLPF
jgi:ABC-type uncharacterized transport system substrate-binding protein